MNSLHPNLIITALIFTVAAAPACDAIDEDDILDSTEDELLADAELADDRAEHARDAIDGLADAPSPVLSYGECPASASFCFWEQNKYGGYPTALPKGDFAINFDTPIKSMLKRNGTYRVKLFSKAGFTGNCAVFGLADKYADSPNLPFDVRSAQRMEPWEGGCSP